MTSEQMLKDRLTDEEIDFILECDKRFDSYNDSISDWSFDFWFGIKSGFPLCCILYFCDVWIDNHELQRVYHRAGYENGYSSGVPPLESNNRVMCPDCISQSLANVLGEK